MTKLMRDLQPGDRTSTYEVVLAAEPKPADDDAHTAPDNWRALVKYPHHPGPDGSLLTAYVYAPEEESVEVVG